MARAKTGPSSLSIPSSVPTDVQRLLRNMETEIAQLRTQIQDLGSQVSGKLGNSPADIRAASEQVRNELQASGAHPMSIAKLPGVAAQPQMAQVGSVTPVNQLVNGTLVTSNGQLYIYEKGTLVPAFSTGNLTELTSDVLTIAGGTGAVVGSGTSIQVIKASATTDGYLSRTDWVAFSGSSAALLGSNNTWTGTNTFTGAVALPSGATLGGVAFGSAATQPSSAFDAAGAATAAIAALLAGSNTWNGALQTINSNITLWGELTLKAAGMDWSAATIFGDGLFTGDMHFPYSNGFWYASPNATGWFEFRVITSQGGSLAADFLGWQYNTRTTVGGTDVWLTAFQLNSLTGALTFFTPSTFGKELHITGGTAGNIRGGAFLIVQAPAGDPLYLNYDSGASVIFCDGATGQVGAVNSAGNLALSMSGAPRQQLSVGSLLDLYSSATALSPTVNSIRAGTGALLLNSYSTGAVYLSYEGGTGGVIFGNGASGIVASVSSAGTAAITGLVTSVRTITTTDTATGADHTLLFTPSAAFTESLPASPVKGQELFLVNANSGGFAVTVSGNGKSIWTLGTTAASISMAANTTAILQYDGTLWRQIK